MARAADTHAKPSPSQPSAAARAAGLRYIRDSTLGIGRRRCGKGFVYLDTDGRRIRDNDTIARIKQLIIPPAWADVWIAPFAHAHIQAIGRDDRGRKQYIYHPGWARIRNEAKFDRMIAFSEVLPRIRQRTERHLRKRDLTKEKVLATVVRLLDSTYVRIGNPQYAKQNDSFGLTTLRNRHVHVSDSKIHLEFRGKRGVEQQIDVRDKRLARIVRECMEIPGYTVFQYYDEAGKRQPVDSGDINDYLHDLSGGEFTAKDFRTWGGSLHALLALVEIGEAANKTQAKKNVVAAIKQAAKKLGNQPSACRKYYIHPVILDCYAEGELLSMAGRYMEQAQQDGKPENLKGLEPEEWVMLRVLEEYA